jgi:hypothetical protein
MPRRVPIVVILVVTVAVMMVCVVADVFMRVAEDLFTADAELGGADTCTGDPLHRDCVLVDRQAPERASDLLDRDACIDQRADDHIAGGTREAVEVQDLHNPAILSTLKAQGRMPNVATLG